MFVWVTLPEHLGGAHLLERAIREAHVAFVPREAFFADRSQRNHVRLSFSLADSATAARGGVSVQEL